MIPLRSAIVSLGDERKTEFFSFNNLNQYLFSIAPKEEGKYEKVEISFTWEDNHKEELNYRILKPGTQQENPNGLIDAGDALYGKLSFLAGIRKPKDMSDYDYKESYYSSKYDRDETINFINTHSFKD